METSESHSSQDSIGETTASSSTPQIALPLRTLLRLKEHKDYGTFGVMINDDAGIPINATIEKIWKNNEPFHSCIPEGEYTCKRFSSARHPDTFEITNVPGRKACLFHIANLDDDVEGCVGVAEGFDPVWNKKENRQDYGVVSSAGGFSQFMAGLVGHSQFKLVVRWAK